MPTQEPFAVHMAHRYIAAIVGLMIVAVAAAGMTRGASSAARWMAGGVLVLFAAQIMVGAGTVWSGFGPELKSIHLTMATLVWAALVLLAATVLPMPALVSGGIGRVAPAPELRGSTT
jgi:heme A synthase